MYGMHHSRKVSLPPQQYILQRLMNREKYFRTSTAYVFACLYYVERHALERQINISYSKGSVVNGNLLRTNDAYSVFDRVPSTPKYWQQKRFELVAKLTAWCFLHVLLSLVLIRDGLKIVYQF